MIRLPAARLVPAVIAVTVTVAATSLCLAVTGKEWVLRDRSDYDHARLEKTTLTPEGRIVLSPRVRPLGDVPQSVVWCLVADGHGSVYAGGGNEGQVIEVGPSGSKVVFDGSEVEIQALALDDSGTLYVGASPGGKVYRVSAPGKSDVFFDSQAKYVWALAFDASGALLVATGQPGRVYRVHPGGKADVLLESRDDNVRTLVPDGHGGFLAGSDGGGIVYRIDSAGRTTVLYDSPEREISALATIGDDVYAAAISPVQGRPPQPSGAPARGPVTHVRVTAEGSSEVKDNDDEDQPHQAPSPQQQQQRRQQPAERFTGAIYRISPDGLGRKIWDSSTDLPLSLLAAKNGQLLAGLSERGRILSLTPEGDASDLALLGAEQVSALLRSGDDVYAATSNSGAVYEILPAYAQEGTILGEVRDAGFTSTWGAISWDAATPAGTSVSFQVRTGDTEDPDSTWSDWSAPLTDPGSSVIERPPARFLQWKATLKSRGEATPVLKSTHIFYQPDNMPPVIESVDVLAPGVNLQSTGPASPADSGPDPGGRHSSPPRRSFDKGMRSVTWQADDANDDPLQAEVQYRAEDETVWKTMQTGVQDNFYAWDSTAMPDGVYRIRIVVSDAEGNPPGKGLSSQRVSAPFEVDNTPPVVSEIKAKLGSREAEVTAVATDTFSPIAEVAYSVDASDWVIVLPVDGVADRPRESVRFKTNELSPGEHSIVIRARDRAGNTSAGKVLVQVP